MVELKLATAARLSTAHVLATIGRLGRRVALAVVREQVEQVARRNTRARHRVLVGLGPEAKEGQAACRLTVRRVARLADARLATVGPV